MALDRHQLQSQIQSYAARGQWAQAEQVCQQLARIAPHHADTHFWAGQVALRQRRWQIAYAAFERCLKIDGNRLDAVLDAATALLQLGRHGESHALLGSHQSQLLSFAGAAFRLGELLSRLGLHAQAMLAYRAANEKQPNADQIQAALAACATKNG